ncbi:uroporphyrinogen decarboxylase family protein [Desulfoscipio geothermicus]|uniref:uroporphyrinogen decarboxylase family protein n=1 Tax=Desulfoscipio geothermicus TaxID=39060 RepID=UPI0013F4CC35|nr:uroporphyrinogen decarboxylase family protein [Desulfoscipio geothermicus]
MGRPIPDPPGSARTAPEILEVLAIDNISYNFAPPRYAEIEKRGDIEIVGAGKLKTWQDFEECKKKMPDPGAAEFYKPAEEYLKKYRKDYAALAGVRFGPSNTYLSMGIEHFSYMLFDDPDLVDAIMDMFSSFSLRVLEVIQNMDFDVIFVSDDLAFRSGTFISPKHMERFFMPHMRKVAAKIEKPWIYHSCGNINSILDELLTLGMNGISNLEPGPMDIFQLKKDYGNKVCLMGNIDLHYTLSKGTVEETENEVREKIHRVGPGGGYIIATSNGVAAYCKPENIMAMNNALLKYGHYPL